MITRKHSRNFVKFMIAASIYLVATVTAMAAEDEFGAWTIVSASDAFESDSGPSRWLYTVDAQARYFDLGSGANQYLLRPGIGYSISDNMTVWAGYARLRARSKSGNVVDENRFWQQLAWTAGHWAGGKVTMRTRIEQRSVSAGDDVRLVLRFQTKYVRKLGGNGETSLIIGLEPFVDLNDTDWGGDSGFGQNRTYVGFGRRLSENLSMEAGYMNQFIWIDGGEDRVNHLATLHFKIDF